MPTTPFRRALAASRYRARECPGTTNGGPASRCGAATVEFALVAPLLFLLVLGSIEFGRVMMLGQLVTNAARAACRQGTLSGTSNSTLTQGVSDTFTAEGVTGGTVTIKVNDVVADVSTAASGDKISVQVQVPLVQNGWLPTAFFVKAGNASNTIVMRHE